MGFACVVQPHLLDAESLEQMVASWTDQEVTTENCLFPKTLRSAFGRFGVIDGGRIVSGIRLWERNDVVAEKNM